MTVLLAVEQAPGEVIRHASGRLRPPLSAQESSLPSSGLSILTINPETMAADAFIIMRMQKACVV